MGTLISILIIVASLLLILIVMIQNSKGGGLDMNSQAANYLGNSSLAQSTDTVEKVTWYLAAAVGFLCLLSAILYSNTNTTASFDSGIAAPTTPTEMPQ
jgi:preprotein translocase subunit SecG